MEEEMKHPTEVTCSALPNGGAVVQACVGQECVFGQAFSSATEARQVAASLFDRRFAVMDRTFDDVDDLDFVPTVN